MSWFKNNSEEPSLETSVATSASNDAIKEIEKRTTFRGSGLVKVLVSGHVDLDSPDSEVLAQILGSSHVSVAQITPEVLLQVKRAGHLESIMLPFLASDSVSIYLENEQGVKMTLPRTASTRESIRVRQFSRLPFVYQSIKKIHRHHTVRTSIACALACSCLRHKEYELFTDIISVAPKRMMQQMTSLPFEGNIFTPDAIVAVLKRLAPENSQAMLLIDEAQNASEAIFLALKHYFSFAPVLGLKRHIPKLLSLQRKGADNRDLLIQNHLKFAAEVAFIAEKLLHAPDFSKPASPEQAAAAGAQVALLVGNAFEYSIEFCEGLQRDKKKLLAKIGTGVDIARIAVGAASSATSTPGGVAEGVSLGATKIGEIIAKWATGPEQEMNIPKMAAQLARLSDAYKDRSRRSFLVPGDVELSITEMRKIEAATVAHTVELLTLRNDSAGVFHRNYTEHLSNFRKRYLESSLVNAAP